MTPAQFRAVVPAFARASDALIADKLAMAERRTPVGILGELQEDGVKYLAAHLLALEPGARDLVKGEKVGESTYGRERKTLEAIVSSGHRVAKGEL
jgi:hypothetical protein